MSKPFIPRITVFHCIHTFTDSVSLPLSGSPPLTLKSVKMACSSMVKDVYLLRAFESGADAVVVMVCPEGHCRYIEGNIRAAKRVAWVKHLLDEIGLGAKRLSLHHITAGDTDAAARAIETVAAQLDALGPNPAG